MFGCTERKTRLCFSSCKVAPGGIYDVGPLFSSDNTFMTEKGKPSMTAPWHFGSILNKMQLPLKALIIRTSFFFLWVLMFSEAHIHHLFVSFSFLWKIQQAPSPVIKQLSVRWDWEIHHTETWFLLCQSAPLSPVTHTCSSHASFTKTFCVQITWVWLYVSKNPTAFWRFLKVLICMDPEALFCGCLLWQKQAKKV